MMMRFPSRSSSYRDVVQLGGRFESRAARSQRRATPPSRFRAPAPRRVPSDSHREADVAPSASSSFAARARGRAGCGGGRLMGRHPIIAIEDPFAPGDGGAFIKLKDRLDQAREREEPLACARASGVRTLWHFRRADTATLPRGAEKERREAPLTSFLVVKRRTAILTRRVVTSISTSHLYRSSSRRPRRACPTRTRTASRSSRRTCCGLARSAATRSATCRWERSQPAVS